MERPKLHRPSCIQNASRPGGIGRSAHLAEVPFGVEALSPFGDQGIRLSLAKTTPDDEVLAATYGPGLSRRMPAVRKGWGGLPASVFFLPPGSVGVAGGGRWTSRGDSRGGVLAVSQRRNISLQS